MQVKQTTQEVPASPARRYHHAEVKFANQPTSSPSVADTLEALRLLASVAPGSARVMVHYQGVSADWSSDPGER